MRRDFGSGQATAGTSRRRRRPTPIATQPIAVPRRVMLLGSGTATWTAVPMSTSSESSAGAMLESSPDDRHTNRGSRAPERARRCARRRRCQALAEPCPGRCSKAPVATGPPCCSPERLREGTLLQEPPGHEHTVGPIPRVSGWRRLRRRSADPGGRGWHEDGCGCRIRLAGQSPTPRGREIDLQPGTLLCRPVVYGDGAHTLSRQIARVVSTESV